MIMLYPITKPLAFCLDVVLGEEFGTIYSKNELVQMLKIHERAGQLEGADLQEVEVCLQRIPACNWKHTNLYLLMCRMDLF